MKIKASLATHKCAPLMKGWGLKKNTVKQVALDTPPPLFRAWTATPLIKGVWVVRVGTGNRRNRRFSQQTSRNCGCSLAPVRSGASLRLRVAFPLAREMGRNYKIPPFRPLERGEKNLWKLQNLYLAIWGRFLHFRGSDRGREFWNFALLFLAFPPRQVLPASVRGKTTRNAMALEIVVFPKHLSRPISTLKGIFIMRPILKSSKNTLLRAFRKALTIIIMALIQKNPRTHKKKIGT